MTARPLTGKQRRHLRALASTESPLLHIGKNGITETVERQARDALAARELFKGRVLEAAPGTAAEVAAQLAAATGAEVVQVVGRNFVLFKRSETDPRIVLPE